MSSLRDRVQEIRRFIPLNLQLAMARRRVDSLWADAGYRELMEANMRFLVEHTERAAEIPELAKAYAIFDVQRNYRRWRPKHLITQPVHGIEWLTTRRDPDRGVVLSFMHHGQYDGLMGSIARHGVAMHGVAHPGAFDPDAPAAIRQHFKVCSMVPGCTLVNAGDGAGKLVEHLEQKAVLALASDVAGRTHVTFLGREMLGSFGAARVAVQTNAPVVHLTSHPDGRGGSFFRLHEPLEPGDFAGPEELLTEILLRHEPAVLAWPEAYDSPYGRLAIPAGQA